MKPLSLAVAIAGSVTLSSIGVARPVKDEGKAAADAMITRFVTTWNKADAVAYGEGYWTDAELVDPLGSVWKGRAAIAQTHVDLWAGIFKGSTIKATARNIRRLGPNYLLVDMDLVLTRVEGFPAGFPVDARGAINTHLKHILQKRNGAWKILSAQNTFVAPSKP